jgi:hypothetical protein
MGGYGESGSSMGNSIHIHEDDWGMRNLYPLEALPEASIDVQQAAEAGQRNRAPDGAGWTDVHLIKPPTTSYAAVGLRVDPAAAAVEACMPRVRQFAATASAGFDPNSHDPWGAYEKDAHCYGFNASCFIKLDTKADLVTSIWFECTTEDAAHIAALRAAMLAIDTLVPSVIVDYWNDMTGAVQDSAFLERYFRELTDPGE